ncbi:hypothetical protein NL676_023385 [Syzygium grande]|nr:hypothetical protein NL676_023385 [Syzygium grande]
MPIMLARVRDLAPRGSVFTERARCITDFINMDGCVAVATTRINVVKTNEVVWEVCSDHPLVGAREERTRVAESRRVIVFASVVPSANYTDQIARVFLPETDVNVPVERISS